MSIPTHPSTNQPIDNHRPSDKKREQHPRAKLTQEQVDEIRKLAAQGVDRKSLVERCSVSKSTMGQLSRARRGKVSW